MGLKKPGNREIAYPCALNDLEKHSRPRQYFYQNYDRNF